MNRSCILASAGRPRHSASLASPPTGPAPPLLLPAIRTRSPYISTGVMHVSFCRRSLSSSCPPAFQPDSARSHAPVHMPLRGCETFPNHLFFDVRRNRTSASRPPSLSFMRVVVPRVLLKKVRSVPVGVRLRRIPQIWCTAFFTPPSVRHARIPKNGFPRSPLTCTRTMHRTIK